MKHYNTKITYLKNGKLDIKKTAIARLEYYVGKYAIIALYNIKVIANENYQKHFVALHKS